jgi:hypothetical protein
MRSRYNDNGADQQLSPRSQLITFHNTHTVQYHTHTHTRTHARTHAHTRAFTNISTHFANLSFGPPLSILGRRDHRTESIGRYAEHRIDGAQAGGVVDGQPQVAQRLAEGPILTGQQVNGVERHRHGSDEQIADGQRGDEIVRWMSYVALKNERHDHNEISADCQCRHDDGHEAESRNLPHRHRHRRRHLRHVTGAGTQEPRAFASCRTSGPLIVVVVVVVIVERSPRRRQKSL